MSLKFGITVGNFGNYGKHADAPDLVENAVHAERLGFDSVWVHDHLVMPATINARYPYNEAGVAGFAYRQDIYDPLSMMAAIAVRTHRVSIGTSVLIVPYRNPVIQAKAFATIDQLAEGRLILGVGVGWMQEEFEALGIGERYPRRGSITDEWLRIWQAFWRSEGPVSFTGKFVSFEDAEPGPRPHTSEGIPFWIGGKGDVAHRRVARIGDGYHTISSTPQQVREELVEVRAELERVGRDPDELVVSMLGPRIVFDGSGSETTGVSVQGSTQAIIDQLGEYVDAGMHHVLATPSYGEAWGEQTPDATRDAMQQLAEEVIPAFRT